MGPEKNTKVRDLMSRGPVTLKRSDVLDLADDVMELGRIRHVPILETNRLVGLVTQRDLFRYALAIVLRGMHRARKEALKSIQIDEVMTEPVITITPGTSIKDAARLMVQKKIGCLPVVERGKLVGLITETDILRLVAE